MTSRHEDLACRVPPPRRGGAVLLAAAIAASVLLAASPPDSGVPAPAAGGEGPDTALAWAETIESAPNPAVIVDPVLRAKIESIGLPWRVREKSTGIELLLIPPGSFTMGSPSGDPRTFPDETPARAVTITRPFYLGRTEVTRAQWEASAAARNGGVPSGSATLPIEGVSWREATAFATRHGMRLPTEAEWEYACRAGGEGPSRERLGEYAWHWPISGGSSRPVATKLANDLGLHDMLGNAFEWVADRYGPYDAADTVDPRGPTEGTTRVARGGSWYFRTLSRVARRYDFDPAAERRDLGIRVARDP